MDLETVAHDWSDIHADKNWGKVVGIGRLRKGTVGGKSTVTVRIQLPDGSFAYGETTLDLMRSAMAGFEGAEQRDAQPQSPKGEGQA